MIRFGVLFAMALVIGSAFAFSKNEKSVQISSYEVSQIKDKRQTFPALPD